MPKKYIPGYQQFELGTAKEILHTYYIKSDLHDTIEGFRTHTCGMWSDTSKYFFQEYNGYDGQPLYTQKFKTDDNYVRVLGMLQDLSVRHPDSILSDIRMMHNELIKAYQRVTASIPEGARAHAPEREIKDDPSDHTVPRGEAVYESPSERYIGW